MINEIMEDLYKRIEDSGELGIRRTQLIKEFGKNIKTNLDELLSQGFISLKKHRNSIIYYANKNIDESRLSKPIQNDNQSLDKINYIENESDERMHNLSSIDEKSKSLSNENSSITNMLSSLTNRIDTLTKDNSNSIQDIHSKLNDLANKFDELVNLIERKADKDALVDVENNINNLTSNLNKEVKAHAANINIINNNVHKLEHNINTLTDRLNAKEYEQSIINIKEEVGRLNSILNTLDTQVKSLSNENSSITNMLSSLTNRIDTLTKDRINEIYLRLDELSRRFDILREVLEKKVDSGVLSEIEKSIIDNLKKEISIYVNNISALNNEIHKLENDISILRENVNTKVDQESLEKINEEIKRLDSVINSFTSSIESLSNENSSITNMLSSLTNRIDTLTKDNSNSIQDIHSKLNDLANKFDELVNLIERKADKDALVDVENNINKSIKMLGGLESNLTNAIKDTNEMFERLQRQIGGKADDIKLFEMEKRLENLLVMDSRYASMERLINELDAKIKAVKGEMEDRIRMVTAELSLLKDGDNDDNKISLEQFKMEFDRIVAEHTNSIGWIELIDIRKRICSKYNISKNTFYTLVSQLLDAYNSYELSSGGKEGIVIRGLTHGFVRMI
ncbi:MAG: hypothetical protein QXT32_01640 [Candidatus Nitrosocaldaceae archaeon]